jgi:Viral BACON domain
LAAGAIMLTGGLLVNGCRISKLLSRPTGDGETGGGGGGGGGNTPIVVTPALVVDSALAGDTAPHGSNLVITNGGTWFASTADAWIRVNPTSGGSRATVRLTLDPKDLTPGLHEGVVAIQEHDSTGPIATVGVKFRIQQPVLKVTPANFNFTPTGSADVFSDTLVVTNAGDGPLVWTVTTQNHSAWLRLTDTTGQGAGKIVVRASNAGLPYFGTFTETIIVTAPGAKDSPARIGVTMKRHKHGDATTP